MKRLFAILAGLAAVAPAAHADSATMTDQTTQHVTSRYDGNYSNVIQTGGSDNWASTDQSGDGNSANLTQTGSGNSATVTQSGGASYSGSQSGGQGIVVTQSGATGQVTITQHGTGR